MNTVFCLIKNEVIENVIVADLAFAEKIKTEQGFDSILERTADKNYSRGFVFDVVKQDYVNPSEIEPEVE